ncbi:DUF945 family protein [Celerinatantimonas sp. YJH-8]|uniref:DUF945 family protein n=1 Tax=Celerinatantimonas sp. YJH-8 TaxID=3228714 RepID=UPI0038C5CE37
MLKKTALAAVVIIVAGGIVAAPYIMKPYVIEQIKNPAFPDDVRQNLVEQGFDVTLSSADFQVQGLTSQAVRRLEILNQNDQQRFCLELHSQSEFGYRQLFSGKLVQTHMELVNDSAKSECSLIHNPQIASHPGAARIVQSLFQKGSPLLADVSYSWLENLNFMVRVEPRTIYNMDNGKGQADKFVFKALQIRGQDDLKGHQQTQVNWEGGNLSVRYVSHGSVGQLELALGGISGHSDYHWQSQTSMAPGEFSMQVGSSSMHVLSDDEDSPQVMTFSGLTMSGNTTFDQKQQTFDSSLRSQISDLMFNQIAIGNPQFNVSLNHMSAASDREVAHFFKQMQDQPHDWKYKQDLDAMMAKALSHTQLQFSPIALQQKEHEVSVAGHLDIGALNDARVQQMGDVGLLLELMAHVQADLNVVIDQEPIQQLIRGLLSFDKDHPQLRDQRSAMLSEQVQRVLEFQSQRGYLAYDQSKQRYSSHVVLKNGQLLLNGKSFQHP